MKTFNVNEIKNINNFMNNFNDHLNFLPNINDNFHNRKNLSEAYLREQKIREQQEYINLLENSIKSIANELGITPKDLLSEEFDITEIPGKIINFLRGKGFKTKYQIKDEETAAEIAAAEEAYKQKQAKINAQREKDRPAREAAAKKEKQENEARRSHEQRMARMDAMAADRRRGYGRITSGGQFAEYDAYGNIINER